MPTSFFAKFLLVLGAVTLVGCGLSLGPEQESVPTRPPLAQITLVAPPTLPVTPLPPAGLGGQPTATAVPPTATPSPTETAVPTLTPTPTVTNTPLPTATVCVFDMQFVTDVTIPDNTIIDQGILFAKTWRIRNSGNCTWPPGTSWVFADGATMSGPSTVAVPSTRPGETADITVNLTAPQQPGTYTGYWTLRLADGSYLTDRYFVRIVVPGPPTVSSFTATAVEPFDGTVTLSWSTSFADSVTISKVLPSGAQTATWTLPASGSHMVNVIQDELQTVRFRLTAVSQRGLSTPWEQSVTVACAHTWFFPQLTAVCPAVAAMRSDAVMQTFDSGTMVWLQQLDNVYVLYNDSQQWAVFANTWQEGNETAVPGTLPPNTYMPHVVLGKVWSESPDVRETLGWAINPPTYYQAYYQTGSEPFGGSLYIETPVDSVWWLQFAGQTWQRR